MRKPCSALYRSRKDRQGTRICAAGRSGAAGPRYDGITGGPHDAPGAELRYCLRYRFLPEGRRGRAAVWVEDTGVCSIDAEARPRLAQGTLRIIDNRRRDQEERLLYLGNHDELTGQLNRTRLTEELTRFLDAAGRTPAKGAFLLAGVNDLTLINETYGYDVGDEVITIVGRRIGRALRGRDCIGRFSSNKFGIVLQDCSLEGAEAIARRIMAAVRDSVIDTNVGAVATTLSVGAVLLPQHAGNAQAATTRALQALDLARNSRADRLILYTPCERRDSERRRAVAIADEVVRALNDRRMILALQPIVAGRSLVLTPLAGVVIGVLVLIFVEATDKPSAYVLFSGQDQLPGLIEGAATWSVGALILLAACKGLAYSLALSGFRGGPVFPGMFVGAVVGIALSHLPGLSMIAGAAMGIGAMTVAMLGLPLVSLLLVVLFLQADSVQLTPLVIVAIVVSYIVSARLNPVPVPEAASSPPAPAPS